MQYQDHIDEHPDQGSDKDYPTGIRSEFAPEHSAADGAHHTIYSQYLLRGAFRRAS